jgi:DNA-binding GntR family transcriptional regulator
MFQDTPAPLPRLQRERAVDAAYAALRHAILSSSLKPGQRLHIDQLADQLGVSLTPVRGAVQRLATEGLIDIRPRSGTFVASLSLQDIEETFQIRAALEGLAAELAAPLIAPADLQRLRRLHRDMKKPLRLQSDRETHDQLNSEFHSLILAASGNRRLLEMYSALHAHIQIVRIHAAGAAWSARQRQQSAEHEAIVKALEARDPRAASDALRRHIHRAKDTLLGDLRTRP